MIQCVSEREGVQCMTSPFSNSFKQAGVKADHGYCAKLVMANF